MTGEVCVCIGLCTFVVMYVCVCIGVSHKHGVSVDGWRESSIWTMVCTPLSDSRRSRNRRLRSHVHDEDPLDD